MADTQFFKLITYNVHQWTDAKEKGNFDRVVNLLKKLDLDVVCLQEVRVDGQYSYTVEHLEKLLQMTASQSESPIHLMVAAQWEVVLAKQKLEMDNKVALPLVLKMKQPRSACGATITCFNQRIQVYSIHLDVGSEKTRILQIDQYLNNIDKEEPHLLMGDFNALCKADYTEQEWKDLTQLREKNRWERPTDNLYQKLTVEEGYRDCFPGRDKANHLATVWANTRIDWILMSKNFPFHVQSYQVLSDENASDHFPVLVTFQTEPQPI